MNLIITNANVITLDDRSSRAEAVAILGGRIIRVGTNEDAMSMAVDPVTVLNMEGKTVVPGFVESHVHPVMAAHYNLEMVNCACSGPAQENTVSAGWVISCTETWVMSGKKPP